MTTKTIDKEILPYLEKLWALGYKTCLSCAGHCHEEELDMYCASITFSENYPEVKLRQDLENMGLDILSIRCSSAEEALEESIDHNYGDDGGFDTWRDRGYGMTEKELEEMKNLNPKGLVSVHLKSLLASGTPVYPIPG